MDKFKARAISFMVIVSKEYICLLQFIPELTLQILPMSEDTKFDYKSATIRWQTSNLNEW